uniref:NADH-ubiquinone oxidoreductase chain 6 n=1 Tax=Anaspis sp. ANA01 TaxID=1205535 RepID=A0A0S2MSF8_9CUCU|nr:NADH deshydrogenase subunit 6 [Anaspis sp. ANA01]
MMILLFSLNLSLSIIFLTMHHPLSMGLILLIQTLLISLITGLFSLNYWFSYILFLILVGSMLILFIYMTSIASNEKFKIKMPQILALITLSILIATWTYNSTLYINTFNNDLLTSNWSIPLSNCMIKYLNPPMLMVLVFMIIYLLMTLIAVVKITNFKYGPLRMKN